MDCPSDRIDVERLLAECPVAEVEYYQSLGSTHDLAHQRARDDQGRRPLLIVADAQTAGRGRGQNQWWTGGGSLAFNLVFDPADWQLAGELPAHRSLAVGVGFTGPTTCSPDLASWQAFWWTSCPAAGTSSVLA
jgi:hypothetical protein